MENKNIVTELKRGLLEYAILLIISKKPIYGGDIINKLNEADMITTEGTIYPLLARLKNQELVTYRWEESNQGPPRKYYTLSESGRKLLESYEKNWERIVNTFKFLKS